MENLETMGRDMGNALERTGSRRDALRGASLWGAGLMAATAPMLFSALAKKGYAQSTPTVLDVLQTLLNLEYLTSDFYAQGMAQAGLIPTSDRGIFGTLRDDEQAHADFLTQAVNNAGGTPAPRPTFDFTAGGTYDPFGNYSDFQILSQAFEDLSVRAYKGAVSFLIANDAVLTAILTIHSVEGRHASEVRRLRGGFADLAPQKGWITQNDRGTNMPASTQPVYDAGTDPGAYPAENNVNQGGINVSTLPGANPTSGTEAFDEPLDASAVLNFLGPFIVSAPPS